MNKADTHRNFGFGKALVLAAAGLLVTLSGQAAERIMLGTQVTTVTVSYGDLDLASAAGAKALYARLDTAATKVCGGAPQLLQELQKQHSFRSCRDQALDAAVSEVGSSRLQAVHREAVSQSRVS